MAIDPALAEDLKMQSYGHAVFDAEMQEISGSPIQKFYQGTSVFITGGTGFLGKQLLEKLLRACHGIKKVYLLIRKKKGLTVEERFKNMLQDPLYDQLRKRYPNFSDKIFLIDGDIMELRLGMSDQNWNMLAQEVNIIFHVAATVRFDESLKRAILVNVRSTREALQLARDCSELKSFVYVSTAFSHCINQAIAEKFYDSPVPPQTMIEFVETVDESKIDAITPSLIKGWHFTYTFSKAIAEEAVRSMGKGLPVCVVRPAIDRILGAPTEKIWQETRKSFLHIVSQNRTWVDFSNVFGPSAKMFGVGLGVLKTMLVNGAATPDLVPVDLANNLVITAAWETATSTKNDAQIYALSRIRNKITWSDIHKFGKALVKKLPTPKAVWYSGSIVTSNVFTYSLLSLFLHFIPGLLIDGVLCFTRHKLRLTRIFSTDYKLNVIARHFLFTSYYFDDDNSVALMSKMSKLDREIFKFDMAEVNTDFIVSWWLGMRKYIIKDELKDTEYAVKKQRWMRFVNFIVAVIYLLLISVLFYGLFKLSKIVFVLVAK